MARIKIRSAADTIRLAEELQRNAQGNRAPEAPAAEWHRTPPKVHDALTKLGDIGEWLVPILWAMLIAAAAAYVLLTLGGVK